MTDTPELANDGGPRAPVDHNDLDRANAEIDRLRASLAAAETQVMVMRDEEAQRVKLKAVAALIDKNRNEEEAKSRAAMESIGIVGHWSYTCGKTVGAMTLELCELVKSLRDKPNLPAIPDPAGARESEREISRFQDEVRQQLLDHLASAGLEGADIDGGGCDSGAWQDFTLSEIRQGFNVLADFYYDRDQAQEKEIAELKERIAILTPTGKEPQQ